MNPKPRAYNDGAWQKSVTDEYLAKVILEDGASVGKSALMPANVDMKVKPAVLQALVKKVSSFGPKTCERRRPWRSALAGRTKRAGASGARALAKEVDETVECSEQATRLHGGSRENQSFKIDREAHCHHLHRGPLYRGRCRSSQEQRCNLWCMWKIWSIAVRHVSMYEMRNNCMPS